MKTASLGLLEVLVVRVNARREWYVFIVGCFGGVSYVTQTNTDEDDLIKVITMICMSVCSTALVVL